MSWGRSGSSESAEHRRAPESGEPGQPGESSWAEAASWRTVLIAGLAISVVGWLAGSAGSPVARLVTSGAFLAIGMRAIPRSSRAFWPWRLMLLGAATALLSAAVRVAHGVLVGMSYPYPSPADALAFGAYATLLAAGLLFVRRRTVERNPAHFVDSVIATLLTGLLTYRFVLADYLSTTSEPLIDRLVNLGYSSLTVLMVGVIFRNSFGPGVRNGSYYLLAFACCGVMANDVLLMLETVGRAGAYSVALLIAPASFAFAAASVAHPGARLLADRPPYRQERLGVRRASLLVGAVVAGPALLFDESWRSHTGRLAITAVVAGLITAAVFARLVLVVWDRERMARQAESLRTLAARFAGMTDPAEIVDASMSAAVAFTEAPKSALAVLYQLQDDGSSVVRAVAGTSGADQLVGTRLADVDGDLVGSMMRHPAARSLERAAAPHSRLMGGWRNCFTLIAPVTQRSGVTHVLTVSSQQVIRGDMCRALESLAAQLGLALDGWTATELVHQQRSDRRFRVLVENSSDLLFVVDGLHDVTFVSSSSNRLLSLGEDAILHGPLADLVFEADRGQIRRLLARATVETGEIEAVEARLLGADGSARWFEIEARDLRANREVRGIVVTARDIRDRRTAEANLLRSEARFRLMVQHSHDVVAVVSDENIITYVSPSIERILALSIENVLGRSVFELLSVSESERVKAALATKDSSSIFEMFVQGGDGRIHALEVRSTDMRAQPEVAGVVLAMRDVTERKSLESDLRHRALHDDLTGMSNRAAFLSHVASAIERQPARSDTAICVMFIDLDGFKLINDSLGHAAGDQVLVAVADRIHETLRTNDVAARLGGDEFGVLLQSITGLHEASAVAERIRATLAQPLHIDLHKFSVTASIGIAVVDDGLNTAEDLLRAADLAMYQAKQGGKDRWDVFEAHLEVDAADELFLRGALHRAIEEQEFVLDYQPIIDLEQGIICGVEALVRWRDPQRGLVPPSGFIPLAEEWGLIGPIGRWVAERATRDLSDWRMDGHDLYCTINVSGRQLADPAFGADFVELVESQVDPGSVVVELTESVLAGKFTRKTFEHFAEHGIRVALDDFGTGYSALSYLQSFPIDMIKIDRAFVNRLGSTSDVSLVQAIQDVAMSIDAVTVAEGIEDPREMALLQDLGIGLGQGFGLTPPVDAATLTKLLNDPATNWIGLTSP